jgi:hypothetical protein
MWIDPTKGILQPCADSSTDPSAAKAANPVQVFTAGLKPRHFKIRCMVLKETGFSPSV